MTFLDVMEIVVVVWAGISGLVGLVILGLIAFLIICTLLGAFWWLLLWFWHKILTVND